MALDNTQYNPVFAVVKIQQTLLLHSVCDRYHQQLFLPLAGTKLYCLVTETHKQYNLVPANRLISWAWNVTVGLEESNGSLSPGL